MRKVSETVVKAFLKGESKKVGNTETNGNALLLHGNMIAYKSKGSMYVCTCGWNTATTCERLNCLFSFLSSFGYDPHITRAFRKQGVIYFAFTNGVNVHSPNGVIGAGRLRETGKVG